MGSNRIKGAALTLLIGDTDPVDYKADVSACTLENEEASGGVTTFEDAATGGRRQYYFNLSAIQSTDPDSLWREIWEHTGETVPFTYAPHGNDEPTDEKPHFVGMVTIGTRPNIGGEAGATNEYVFESRWDIEGLPTMITAPETP